MTLDQAVESARDLLHRAGWRPAVAGHDVWIASGLETVLPETVLLCLQRSDAINVLRRRGIEVFCLSEHVPPSEVAGGSTLDLLTHPATRRFCAELQPLALMAFKPSERLRQATEALRAVLIGGDPIAARAAENKLAFMDLAAAAGLKTPLWESLTVEGDDDLSAQLARFGLPLVVQGARGNAGQRTWLATNHDEVLAAGRAEAGRPVRVAEFVEGVPFTATGLSVRGGLAGWIEACRQLTGIEWLTPHRLGSCGNAWGDPGLDSCSDAVADAMKRVAGALDQRGYHGVFGVDDLGLDKVDRAILSAVCARFGGGPVGLSTLAVSVGEETDTVEEVYEPFLLQRGLLMRTPRGRVATPAAWLHLGLDAPPPPEPPAGLFD